MRLWNKSCSVCTAFKRVVPHQPHLETQFSSAFPIRHDLASHFQSNLKEGQRAPGNMMLPEHICSSDRCKQLHSSKYKLRLFGNSLSLFLFSSGTRMFSSLVETVGAGYFYSDSLCNNFYSKRSTVITLKRKKKKNQRFLFQNLGWRQDLTSGCFWNMLRRRHLQYFYKLSDWAKSWC